MASPLVGTRGHSLSLVVVCCKEMTRSSVVNNSSRHPRGHKSSRWAISLNRRLAGTLYSRAAGLLCRSFVPGFNEPNELHRGVAKQ